MLLDIREGQAIAAMRAWDYDPAYPNMKPMYTFQTQEGTACILLMRVGVKSNTEYPNLSVQDTPEETACLGYFVICTRDRELPLCVCTGSPRTVTVTSEEDLARVSDLQVTEAQMITPFSVFIGQGDLSHAGCDHQDYSGNDGRLRYHVYVEPEHLQVSDGVFLQRNFRSRFVTGVGDEEDILENDDDEVMEEE